MATQREPAVLTFLKMSPSSGQEVGTMRLAPGTYVKGSSCISMTLPHRYFLWAISQPENDLQWGQRTVMRRAVVKL
jgi:hypothetical protein